LKLHWCGVLLAIILIKLSETICTIYLTVFFAMDNGRINE
jgi:hypothetical protein